MSFGASTVNLNFLYKTVYIPVMSYAARAWMHRLEHWAIAKNLKETQRQVLINTTGGYRTSPLQALCTISNNLPIHIRLAEIKELSERAQGIRNETKQEIKARMLEKWQTEWDSTETGRYTYKLLLSVIERQQLTHLQDLDHRVVQLLTGHGPFKKYLLRFHRADADTCEDCGEVDEPLHPILYCPAQEDIRAELHAKATEVGELPWNIATMLRN